jgi:hypothetical protein
MDRWAIVIGNTVNCECLYNQELKAVPSRVHTKGRRWHRW